MSALRILFLLGCIAVCCALSPPIECGAIDCINTYEPVCAVDRYGVSRTFGNECLREVYNCFNKDNPAECPVPGTCESVNACKYYQYIQQLLLSSQRPYYC